MKEGPIGGASLCERFHEGNLEGGLLYWGTRKMRFLRDMQMPHKQTSIFIGALLVNLEGVRLPALLIEMKVYLGSFLGPGGH
jgi:hypothetical protein